ncbi:hypothetical protein KUCAC02_035239 [Chaenocephalus aceratus]|nr:hypothetical protein KUCAC02_035239 [Chaenocephalus aceratus]
MFLLREPRMSTWEAGGEAGRIRRRAGGAAKRSRCFQGGGGWIIVVIVDVAALTIITVAVIRRKRTRGNETQTDENMADPEDGVSYASISYTRKSSRVSRLIDHTGRWWWIIVVIVAVAALTIIPVAVIRRKRTRGTRTETDDDMADPEDGVSYASISYTRKSRRAHLHDDEDDDAVTYSTVRAPSSSSAASADPSLLYATVNKPRKKPM